MIKILIADDNLPFRARLKAFLATYPEVEIVGEAEDGQAALRLAGELKPDVVLMDVKMRGMNGLSATEQLNSQLPHVKVIILSQYDLEAYQRAAEASGACAFVAKKDLVDKLLPTIRRVAHINPSA